MNTFITIDGGCLGNGNLDAKAYGSARIQTYNSDGLILSDHTYRYEYEDIHTNNTAEIRSLYMGLKKLLEIKDKYTTDVTIQTDSQLLYGWIVMGWSRTDDKCRLELDKAEELLQKFTSWKLVKVPRKEIVKLLGH